MNSENLIILKFFNRFPTYIGDDCAVVDWSSSCKMVVTNDVLVDGTHFRIDYFHPTCLAEKSLNVNLSDIAAMGGVPRYVVIGLAIPQLPSGYLESFIDRFCDLCKEHHLDVLGGDTVKSADRFTISVAVIGEVDGHCIKLRSGGKPGDRLYVAGSLGCAHIGLMALERNIEGLLFYKDKFLSPSAKLQEGLFLGSFDCVNSMIDLSDGLFLDLSNLCNGSKLMGNIDMDAINNNGSGFVEACKQVNINPMDALVSGGEDYGLLFSVDGRKGVFLEERFKQKFGYPLVYAGYLSAGEGVKFLMDGREVPFNPNPFMHF